MNNFNMKSIDPNEGETVNRQEEITRLDYEDMSHQQLVAVAMSQHNDLDAFRITVKEFGIINERLRGDKRALANALSASRNQIALGNTFIKVLGDTIATIAAFEESGVVDERDYSRFYSLLEGIISIAPTLYTYLEDGGMEHDAIPF